MALSLFVGRGSAGEDPFDSLLFDSLAFPPSFSSSLRASFPEHPSFARDVAAVANTQVDWKETPDSHIFKANLPGLAKEDVKVQVEDGRVLQISGERKEVEEVKAAMDNGVLTVTVPKVPPPEPKSASRSVQTSG